MGHPLRTWKIALGIFFLFLLPVAAKGQNVITGQETTVQYTGTNAQIVQPNTPANNFVSPGGTNTFLLPIAQPAVSVRVYITNQTANACASTFTLQMFAASDFQTSSFNNSLANWQSIPLQNTDGTLVTIATPNIPASGSIYVSSTTVAAPRVAIQLVNANILNCPNTNMEVTATITPIALTSPLISNASGFNNGLLNQIQGIVPNGGNGATANPVISGGLANPVNTSFAANGLDTFNTNTQVVSAGFAGAVTINTVPRPSTTGEFVLGFVNGGLDSGTSTTGANSGWGCLGISTAGGCGVGGTKVMTLPNASPNTPLQVTFQNATPTQNLDAVFMLLRNQPVFRSNNGISLAIPANSIVTSATLAGSVEVLTLNCNTAPTPCVSSLASSLGLGYKLVARSLGNQSFVDPNLEIWMATNRSPGGADTITVTYAAGATGNLTGNALELTGLNTAPLNQPNLPNQVDGIGNEVVRLDAQSPNQFSCSVTLSSLTTTACLPAATNINGVPVRSYVTDFQINTTVAGTATTIAIVTGTGANCASGLANLSAILYPNTTVGIQNILGTRTPLVAPLQSGICVTQAGTTTGTTTVEIRGFQAP